MTKVLLVHGPDVSIETLQGWHRLGLVQACTICNNAFKKGKQYTILTIVSGDDDDDDDNGNDDGDGGDDGVEEVGHH